MLHTRKFTILKFPFHHVPTQTNQITGLILGSESNDQFTTHSYHMKAGQSLGSSYRTLANADCARDQTEIKTGKIVHLQPKVASHFLSQWSFYFTCFTGLCFPPLKTTPSASLCKDSRSYSFLLIELLFYRTLVLKLRGIRTPSYS